MKTTRKLVVAVGIMLAAASVVAAQDDWSFEVTPYFWAAGIEGDVEVHGHKAEVDEGFDDLFDAVDLAGGLLTVARRDRFVILGQFDYLGLDTDKLDDVPVRGSLETDAFIGALAAGYQFDGPFEDSTIDLMGGVRYTWMENDLDITGVEAARQAMIL